MPEEIQFWLSEVEEAQGLPEGYFNCVLANWYAAWDCIASWFRLVLIHWDAIESTSRCHLPTLQKAKWRLCFHDWSPLGNSRHAKALRWWIAHIDFGVLNDKLRVIVLMREASSISGKAHRHDEHASQQAWRSWLTEGPSNALGVQHRMSRVATGWISATVKSVPLDLDIDDVGCEDDVEGITEDSLAAATNGETEVVPLNQQQAVDEEAAKWYTQAAKHGDGKA